MKSCPKVSFLDKVELGSITLQNGVMPFSELDCVYFSKFASATTRKNIPVVTGQVYSAYFQ